MQFAIYNKTFPNCVTSITLANVPVTFHWLMTQTAGQEVAGRSFSVRYFKSWLLETLQAAVWKNELERTFICIADNSIYQPKMIDAVKLDV